MLSYLIIFSQTIELKWFNWKIFYVFQAAIFQIQWYNIEIYFYSISYDKAIPVVSLET